jgi:hypothetical protein
MKLNQHLKDWKKVVSYKFPNLSLPQISGLATWSFGMVMTQSSSLSRISTLIAQLNQESENTARQRLKEWYKEGSAKAKKGNKRASLEVSQCFAPLLRWMLELRPQNSQELFLALDATTLGTKFTVLSINVLYQGSAVPVAWKVLEATKKSSWKPYWQELLRALKEIVPPQIKVILSADRGVYAQWLFAEIVQLGWHPFLRINHHHGQYQPQGSHSWHPLAAVVAETTRHWSGRVICFPSNPLPCYLLARWDEGYSDPWLIVTDLPPTEAQIHWYGFRCWIECSYRDLKSDGWRWSKTRVQSPERAERYWLAMAVALIWMLSCGREQELSQGEDVPDDSLASSASTHPRRISVFLRGLLTILGRLLNDQSLGLESLFPLPNQSSSPSWVWNSS